MKDIVRPGETISSNNLEKRAGGKGANQAVAVARAGGQVDLVGAIGRDGIWVKSQLENAGVDVSGVLVAEVRNPTVLVLTDQFIPRNRPEEL